MADMKLLLHKMLGIPAGRQTLLYNGVVVNDGKNSLFFWFCVYSQAKS